MTDDIPFGAGSGDQNKTSDSPTVIPQAKPLFPVETADKENPDAVIARLKNQNHFLQGEVMSLTEQKDRLMRSDKSGSVNLTIFAAILQGLATRGDLSMRVPGSTTGVASDASVQSQMQHVAGLTSFAIEAARAAKLI